MYESSALCRLREFSFLVVVSASRQAGSWMTRMGPCHAARHKYKPSPICRADLGSVVLSGFWAAWWDASSPNVNPTSVPYQPLADVRTYSCYFAVATSFKRTHLLPWLRLCASIYLGEMNDLLFADFGSPLFSLSSVPRVRPALG